MRVDRPVALLIAIACASSAAAADSVDPVLVKDLEVAPRANLTLDDDTLRVHPKAMLGVGFNSNIFAEVDGQENDDIYVRGLVGLVADWRLNPHQKLTINGELEVLNYLDSDNEEGNLVGGLLTGDLRLYQTGADVRLHGGYARFDDPLIQSGERILRQNIDGSATVLLQGTTVRTVLEVGASATDYLDDGIDFSEESRDNTNYRAVGRVGWTSARDTFYYALLGVDFNDYWENIQYNDSLGLTAGVGAQVRLGVRSVLTAEGGVTYRMYDDNYAGVAAYDDEDVYAPYVSVAARWPWESGSQVGLKLFSRIDESLTSNAAWIYGLQLDGRYRLLAHSALIGAVAGYHSEDSGQGSGIPAEERDTIEAMLGVEHEITKGFVGRLKGTYTDSTAELSNDFTRYIVALDLAVAY
ncbi:MAG: outer membrane beta-barrel protein [Planctomycetes bacterium]|nr:outer membrane beta-barrel protein [Planctomycetota bacterium]